VKKFHLRQIAIRRPKGPSIYLVTVLSLQGAEIVRSRTWGWFAKFTDAEKAVLENHTDLFEMHYYTHAVIEEYPPGLLAIAKTERWYKASYSRKRHGPLVAPVKKPRQLKRVINFGIG
jgi:hypothetical protein